MYCWKCGEQNDDNSVRCARCNEIIRQPPQGIGDDAGMRALLPVGRSGLAIAAGYAGLFSPLMLPAPVAILLGILAIVDIKRHPEKHGMGRAIFGIAMGVACPVLLVVCFLSST